MTTFSHDFRKCKLTYSCFGGVRERQQKTLQSDESIHTLDFGYDFIGKYIFQNISNSTLQMHAVYYVN